MNKIESQSISREMIQSLAWGAIKQERTSPSDTMYAVTGRRLYVIGDIDGQFRPRSNAYDLYAYGKPSPDDPLAGKLQGVWAQPVKGFDSYSYALETNGSRWVLDEAVRFTQFFSSVEFEYQHPDSAVLLRVTRRDFPALDLPVLCSTLSLYNAGSQPLELQVTLKVIFDLQDAWFTSLGERRNTGETLSIEPGALVAHSEVLPDRWAAAAGSLAPAEFRLLDRHSGEITCQVDLAPQSHETLTFALVIEIEGGVPAALELLRNSLRRAQPLLNEKQALYDQLACNGPRLVSPEPALNAAFDLARANLQLLEAEQPDMGRYFYAGLEIFPFWFSNDGAYSVPGLMAAGLRDSALNHLRIGLANLQEGRIPHQISPSGKVAFAGNAQETPQWVMSLWDAYRWTGDRNFLSSVYAGARQGMFEYALSVIDGDGDGYPSGPGMVEVEGMGAEKLDSAAFTWAALLALANMAEVLGKNGDAQRARSKAASIAARFDADWWDEAGGSYAMSLEDPGNARKPLPHWAVVVPLEVGLASSEHAVRTFTTLRNHYLNRWGMKHTVGSDERVWTLTTATLSRAAFRYGEPELGLDMLRRIAATLEHGSIGLFHELIPEGACIVQLWSGATFLRGVIEDLLGVEVYAAEHRLALAPHIPLVWNEVRLEDLTFGEHCLSLHLSRSVISVRHNSGAAPVTVWYANQETSIPVGGTAQIEVG